VWLGGNWPPALLTKTTRPNLSQPKLTLHVQALILHACMCFTSWSMHRPSNLISRQGNIYTRDLAFSACICISLALSGCKSTSRPNSYRIDEPHSNVTTRNPTSTHMRIPLCLLPSINIQDSTCDCRLLSCGQGQCDY
jgi:hypothetical protein